MACTIEMSLTETPPLESGSSHNGSFRDHFCRELSCPPEAFEREVMRRCLFRRARLLYPWIELFNGDFFFHERKLIERIANERNLNDIRHDIDFYQHKFVSMSARRGAFRIRISGQRLIRIVRRVMQADVE
ncbi:MAG: hypothetical protein JJU00_10215 [Opitutales bacterium]|nr:hypothetical protein [Opitutales bacterium]